ncbi:hypothetical protein AMAG_09598 [Allomyces macrogynus ATCC 38327]|uniref:Signal peptidase complex subunit 1 n=1 Tax=Allomyces macrogynus (strain ATCC 38327) TaxID=578462 RepID=A0A0L0STH1_ALLM3|nr:hypothetical protein AMAG_09598 [Allomyces macrogynus ATCC 38327]|eukprot:KNE65619.1 hypothetical protein AMAG_09598 [Allomyces macrogynus ATCC 38327]
MSSFGTIDFVGQRTAENIIQWTILGGAVGGTLLGIYLHSLRLVFQVFFASVVVASVATIPPWGYLRKHPVQFAPDSVIAEEDPTTTDEKQVEEVQDEDPDAVPVHHLHPAGSDDEEDDLVKAKQSIDEARPLLDGDEEH